MTLRNQVLVWVGFTVIVILLIWLFRPILLPFVIGIALAYILNPAVVLVERAGIARAWSAAIVLLAVLAVIIGILLVITPLIVTQVGGLIARLPGYVSDLNSLIRSVAPQLNEWLGPERAAQLQTQLTQFIGSGVEFLGTVTAQVAQSGLTVLNTIAVLILTPVVAFYLLLDWSGMVKGIDDLLPREHRREIRQLLDQIDRSIAGVFRGQGSVILVLCVYYATALTLTGLNFGLVIGLMTGLFSFIPFFGFLTGFVLSMGIAFVQFSPNWWFVAIVFLVYMIGQFLEGNVLYPRLVGQSININPVWMMFALLALGAIFGFVGLLLAVPMAAIGSVLVRYGVRKYKDSTLYRGQRPNKIAASEPELALAEPAMAEPAPAKTSTRRTPRRK